MGEGKPAAPLPYGRQSIDESDVDAVARVLRGDWLTTGPAVERFERELADHAGVPHAVVVNSGTAALHIAYEAAGVGPGDIVVTSPLTFVATASCALHLGAGVRFVDVDAATGNLDPDALAAALDDDVRLVVPIDFAGHLADYAAIARALEGRECRVVADAAHSFGATRDGRSSAQWVDAAATSFHPVKGLTTAEGGAMLTRHEAWARSAARFRNHGIERDPARQRHEARPWYYEVQALGLNYRLPDVLCALGSSQLARFDGFLARRRMIAARYDEALAAVSGLELPTTEAGSEPSWHLYVVRVPEANKRHAFFERLREEGLGVQLHYHPVHRHPLFEDLGFRAGECPVAEDFAARAVSLPIFPAMTDSDIDRVIETVTRVAEEVL